jgi:hypothetical protein
MSDTPETDAFQQTDQCAYDSMWRGFARKLERERDILKKHTSIMDISHKTANDEYFKLAVENENLERERDEARSDLAYRLEQYAIKQLQLSDARKTILELQKK